MQSSKLLKRAGVAVAVAVTGLVAAILIWRIQTPSSAVKKLHEVYANRPSVPDADNAYLDSWGFLAPEDTDSLEFAARRLAWFRKKNDLAVGAGPDPGTPRLTLKDERFDVFERVVSNCGDGAAQACADSLARVDRGTPLTRVEATLGARYQAMLSRHHWIEIAPVAIDASLPDFAAMLEAQRIMLIRLRDDAKTGDAVGVRDALNRDLAFWREMQKSSYALISKMIGVAAIRQHFFYANYALRELPADLVQTAIPEQWKVEFSIEEHSMLRVMAGELLFFEGAIRKGNDAEDAEFVDDDEEAARPEDIVIRLLRRFPRVTITQYQINRFAGLYLAVGERFDVPLDQFATTIARMKADFSKKPKEMNFENYAYRVASVEGWRRQALATAEMRSGSTPADKRGAALRGSSYRDPYTHSAFTWDAHERAIVWIAPEDNKRRRMAYLY